MADVTGAHLAGRHQPRDADAVHVRGLQPTTRYGAPDGKAIVVRPRSAAQSSSASTASGSTGRRRRSWLLGQPDAHLARSQSWSPDGRTLVFTTKSNDTGEDIWTLSLDGAPAAKPWLADAMPRVGPDASRRTGAGWPTTPTSRAAPKCTSSRSRARGQVAGVPSGGGGFSAVWSRGRAPPLLPSTATRSWRG
ncbi:MAG: hypothetical protein MZW92_40590 [Comamonadaceae bacterium]|nr:hypothetical protein [Comamonadaceae bacterium]